MQIFYFLFFFNSNQYLHDQITHIIDQDFFFTNFMNSLNILKTICKNELKYLPFDIFIELYFSI